MFYVLIFSILAVVLVVAGIAAMSRRRKGYDAEERMDAERQGHAAPSGSAHSTHHSTPVSERKKRKKKRAQSAQARRKRH